MSFIRRVFQFTSAVVLLCGAASASANLIIDDQQSSVRLTGNMTADVMDGAIIAGLDVLNTAVANVHGGEVSWLRLYGNGTANVHGGDISWIWLNGASQLFLDGVDDLSWLVMDSANAVAHIFANHVSYANGHLSGVWGNGEHFSFWAVNGNFATGAMPSNIIIHAAVEQPVEVPTPATVLLLGAGLMGLFVRKRLSR